MFICDGFACGYRGLFLTAVSDGLGVKRTLVSVGDSFRSVTGAVLSMFFGVILHKFGARKLVGAGLSVLILSLIVYSRAGSVYEYWIASVLMGAGTTFTSTAMVSVLIHQWFEENVGSVLGIVLAASGLGSAVGSQVISPILYSGDPMGFRWAYMLTAIIVAVVALVIVPLLREKRENKPAETVKNRSADVAETTASRGNRAILWVVGGCVFLTALSIMGVNSIYGSHMLDVGIDAKTVGTATGILSVALIGSKLLTGVFYDRLGLRAVLLICQAAAFTGFVILALMNQTAVTSALIFPAIFAVALPLETIVITLIVSDVFGKQLYSRYIGMFSAIASIGFALAPPLSNLIYDTFGSYIPAIIGSGAIMLLVSAALHITITIRKRRIDNA